MSAELAVQQAPQNNALNRVQMPVDIEGIEKLATKVCQTNLVPKAYKDKPEETFAAMLFGSQFGLNPLLCLSGIANINGSPALFGKTALAVIQASPGFVDLITVESNNDRAIVKMVRRGREPVTCSYTIEEAKAGQLVGRDTYKKHLPDMLWWRATHRCIRQLYPDIAQGIAPMSDSEVQERHVNGELIETSYEGPTVERSTETIPGTAPTVEQMLKRIGQCARLTDLDNAELLQDLGTFTGNDRQVLGDAWKQRRADLKAATNQAPPAPQPAVEFPPATLADIWAELTSIKTEHGLDAAITAVDTLEGINDIDKKLLVSELRKYAP